MGQVVRTDSGRRARAAGGDELSPRPSAVLSMRLKGALAACVCALALVASSSPVLSAQSGRRSAPTPTPAPRGKKGAPAASQTPAPTPMRRIEGPIAEPPAPSDPKAKGRKEGTGIRPPEAVSQTPKA